MNLRIRIPLAIICMAFMGFASLARAQSSGFETLPGRRHVVVLFDTSASMWSTAVKRRALDGALGDLATALFDGKGKLSAIPSFRPGQDLISVVHFGFDRSRDHSRAYERLRNATLRGDYVRVVVPARTNLTRSEFLGAFRVTQAAKTNINALAWAIPLGLDAARVSPGTTVQNTFVILLNDSQLNDGSIALERLTLEHWLGGTGRANLARAETAQSKNVRLTGAGGSMLPLVSEVYGSDRNMVTVSGFRAESVPSMKVADSVRKLRPLEGASVSWKGDRLAISFDVPRELRGHAATLTAWVDKKGAATKVALDTRTHAELKLPPSLANADARVSLSPEFTVPNDLLGTQTIGVRYEELVRLPDSPESSSAKRNRAILKFLLVAGLGAAGVTIYRHGWLVSHLRLRLPGYAPFFEPPPLSQMRVAKYAVRLPSGNGDVALSIRPPQGWIAALLYRDATVKWDSHLQGSGLEPGVTEASFGAIRKGLELRWVDRTPEATVTRILIERQLPLSIVHRLEIIVRFAALPRLSGNRRILEGDSTS